MGRWSAAHWKTATFGWLAFVVVAFALGGAVGHEEHRPEHVRAGPVGPHGPDPRRRLQAARGRERPDPEPTRSRERSGLQTPRSPTSSRASRRCRTSSTSARRRFCERRPDRADGHAALVEFEIRGDKDKAGRQDRPGPRDRRRRAACPPGFFIGEFGDASAVKAVETAYGNDLAKAGAALAPDHADHPRARVRRAGGGGHPAAARADRRLRDVRAGRAAEPPAADGARRPPAIVLLIGLAVGVDYSMFYLKRERQERAAGRRRTGRARGRRGDLRPLGAHLRADRDGGDGRHVPDRRRDVRVARPRDDPRRRRRGARLADRAAGAALEARRQRRPAARPVRRPAPPRRRRRPDLGRDRRPRPAPAGCCRRSLPAGSCWRSRCRRSSSTCATPGPETFPQSLAVVKTYDRMQQAFPGTALPANVVVKAPNVNAPAVRAAIGRLEQRALASGRDVRADHRRRQQGRARSRTSPSRSTATEPTPPRTRRSPRCATRSSRRPSARSRTREAGVTGLTAQWKDSGRRAEVEAAARSSPSCSLFAFALMLVAFRSIVDRGQGDRCSTCSRSPPPTACSCSSSSTASARACSASAPPPGSTRWCRCCCS